MVLGEMVLVLVLVYGSDDDEISWAELSGSGVKAVVVVMLLVEL